MSSTIALDFDDLIFPLMDELVPYVNSRHGWNYTLADYRTFEFEVLWGSTRQEAIEIVDTFFSELDLHPQPLSGAAEAVGTLRSAGHRLVVVTARHDELEHHTQLWIEQHLPGVFDDVQLCNSYQVDGRPTRRKVDVCRELGAEVLVDDSLGNVSEMAVAGGLGLLFGNYPWNRADELPPGVERMADWPAVLDRLLHSAVSS